VLPLTGAHQLGVALGDALQIVGCHRAPPRSNKLGRPEPIDQTPAGRAQHHRSACKRRKLLLSKRAKIDAENDIAKSSLRT
jgi:hypothetical protein